MPEHLTVDILVDAERGYRQRITGVVSWKGELNGEDHFILKRISVYAYHPDDPEGGRYLPSRSEWLCKATDIVGEPA